MGIEFTTVMKTFTCTKCGQTVFFDNTQCVSCGARLGFVPEQQAMVAFAVDVSGVWHAHGVHGQWRPCANDCNWMVDAHAWQTRCLACRLTTLVPALNQPGNATRWQRMEAAKRQALHSLLVAGLAIPTEPDTLGPALRFEIKAQAHPGEPVITGHLDGVITLDVAEADDATRESIRERLREPYRTLVGHLRHELGHFYWDRLIKHSHELHTFRALFGDERLPYASSLSAYYAFGPPPDWASTHISAYASAHPLEDWAETWAHYFHIMDAIQTASDWGVTLGHSHVTAHTPSRSARPVQGQVVVGGTCTSIEELLVQQWLPLCQMLNLVARGLGQGDLYPFTLPNSVIMKLSCVHQVVQGARSISSPH